MNGGEKRVVTNCELGKYCFFDEFGETKWECIFSQRGSWEEGEEGEDGGGWGEKRQRGAESIGTIGMVYSQCNCPVLR